jgi:hypothetical protein
MNIWRDKLVTCFPRVLNGGLEFGTDCFVEVLEMEVVAMVG